MTHRYPIEIELTDFCSLSCINCVNPLLKDKSFILKEDYTSILQYIYDNKDTVLYINMSGIGDIFLHPDICSFLDLFIDVFQGSGVRLLIPTKGQTINKHHFNLFEKINQSGIMLNVSVGIYSVRESLYNSLAGGNNSYGETINFLKEMRKRHIPFSLELLLGSFSICEKEAFIGIANALQCDYAFQPYHNFSGIITGEDFGGNECTFNSNDEYIFDDFYCSFIPFFDSKGHIYSCSISGKKNPFFIGNINDIFLKFPKYINLVKYIKTHFLSKEKCHNCSIYKEYERKTSIGSHSNKSV